MASKIAVFGLGRVGLPAACYFASLGHSVVGYDSNMELARSVWLGKSPVPWEPDTNLSAFKVAFSVKEALAGTDIVYIIVPTPHENGSLSSVRVRQALQELGTWEGLTLIASTLDPRDATSVVNSRPFSVYNPPLIRLGHVAADLRHATVGLIGTAANSLVPQVKAVWQWNGSTKVCVGSPIDIAVAKLAINTSLSLRIAWANELESVCEQQGANAGVVLDAVSADPRLGSGYMVPGWPPSGPCLPRDVDTWLSMSPSADIAWAFHRTHILQRRQMIDGIVDEIVASSDTPVVAVLGLTYNPNALDTTKSLGMELLTTLNGYGITSFGYDPSEAYFSFPFPVMGSAEEAVKQANVVVIATPWPEFANLSLDDRYVIDCTRRDV